MAKRTARERESYDSRDPFSMDTGNETVAPLRAAGLNDTSYKACLDGIIDDYKPWKTTRFETALNPFKLTDGDKPKHDLGFTLAWMERCRRAEPDRCVLDNHNLDNQDKLNKDLLTMYDAMSKNGASVELQMGPTRPADFGAMRKSRSRRARAPSSFGRTTAVSRRSRTPTSRSTAAAS